MDALSEAIPFLLILGGLLVASAFFSGTEVAMFSLRRVDREQMLRSERGVDSLVTRLLAHPRRLITTVLIGNEAVNVAVSAVVAGMAPVLFPGRPELQLVLLSTAVALPLLLLVGEITPKTVAIKRSVAWSRNASVPLWIFGVIVTPLRIVVSSLVKLLMRPLGGSVAKPAPRGLTEQEFKTLVDAGSADGHVDAREHRTIHRVFEFCDKTIDEVMVSRDRIFALPHDPPTARLITEVATRGYSRVPIYEESLDEIAGIVYARDLVATSTDLSVPLSIRELLREPLFVPRTMSLERLFRMFARRRTHMALVVNEYGALLGLVTMEDLLEGLFEGDL